MTPLILASTSRYRRELLERLRVPFTVESPGVDEDAYKSAGLTPRQLAERLAYEKARAVHARHPQAIVIGSDQVLCLGNQALGKPGTAANALEQLRALRAKTHELVTALVVLTPKETLRHTDITRLTMEDHSDEALRRYVQNDQPLDCAGSYKIESQGVSLFRRIEGEDLTAIQGLPLLALSRLLRRLGLTLP
jgi:septum formation protein